MATPAAELHPADLSHERRISRVLARLHAAPAYEPRCDHGRLAGECGNCLSLRHAEEHSIAVRAAYAFGDWPPVDHSRCTPDTCEEVAANRWPTDLDHCRGCGNLVWDLDVLGFEDPDTGQRGHLEHDAPGPPPNPVTPGTAAL